MKKYSDNPRGAVITYSLIQEKSSYREIEWTYGIEAEMTENGTVTCKGCVNDVFLFRDEAENFMDLLAENGVEPCHLAEIIYDLLSV